jgi:hypothetical protein
MAQTSPLILILISAQFPIALALIGIAGFGPVLMMTLFDSELPADSRSGSSLDTLSRPHDDVAHSRCGRIDVVVWLRSPGLGQHEKEHVSRQRWQPIRRKS